MTSQPCSNITIHNGDCLEFIKTMGDGTVDIVLTDPPYGMKYRSARRSCMYDEIKNDDSTDFLDDLMPELNRVMKSDSVLYMFCSHHQIDRFKQAIEKQLKIKNLLVWIKNNHTSGDLKGAFGNRTEFCFMAVKGTPVIQGKRPDNCLFYPATGNKLHPTQKPVAMLDFLISKFNKRGGVVFDPFMGSGSSGVAAIQQDMSFIGCEIEAGYFEIARDQIERAGSKKGPTLF